MLTSLPEHEAYFLMSKQATLLFFLDFYVLLFRAGRYSGGWLAQGTRTHAPTAPSPIHTQHTDTNTIVERVPPGGGGGGSGGLAGPSSRRGFYWLLADECMCEVLGETRSLAPKHASRSHG